MSPKESNLPQDWYEKAKKDMRRVKILLTTEFYIEDRYPYFGSAVPSKEEFEVYMKEVFELLHLLMGINNS